MDQIFKNQTLILGVCIVTLMLFASVFLGPEVAGDGVSYLQATNFLTGGDTAFASVAHRIITTFGGLWLVIGFGKIFGSTLGVWFAMNAVFYAATIFVFYKMLLTLVEDKNSALLGTLFLAGSYAMLNFGLNFLMDMGGWAFYVASIYFLLRYARSQQRKDILIASALVGVGGLFKEYAFLPIVPIAIFLVYENRWSFVKIIRKSWLPSLLALLPILAVYTFVFLKFGYTYADWLETNQQTYVYSSRIIEYIKSLGSLLNLLGLLFVGGFVILAKEWRLLESRIKVFLIATLASILPVFFWPAITQRVLFVTVPFAVIIATFLFRRYPKYLPVFVVTLILYILASFFMDSFLLKFINLPL